MSKQQKSKRQDISFEGSSLKDLREFPGEARREAGHQLDQVQQGLMPDDYKYMGSVGKGAYEIRIRDDGDQYRVIYVAKFEEGIYVLHAFQKTTRETEQKDIDLAKRRYNQVIQRRAP